MMVFLIMAKFRVDVLWSKETEGRVGRVQGVDKAQLSSEPLYR